MIGIEVDFGLDLEYGLEDYGLMLVGFWI